MFVAPSPRTTALRQEGNVCRDRKSTRLNSSHLGISYAVFCLKKKKETKKTSVRFFDQRRRFQDDPVRALCLDMQDGRTAAHTRRPLEEWGVSNPRSQSARRHS